MANLTDLANDALAAIGAAGSSNTAFLASLDDARNEAVLCKRFLASTDKSASLIAHLLLDHKWNFAQARASIAVDAVAPTFGYSYQYTLPADYLLVHRVSEDDESAWMVEGGKIHTDLTSPIYIEYTAFITDVNKWSSQFYQCMSTALQIRLCPPLKSDMKMAQALTSYLYSTLLPEARAADGVEGSQQVQTTQDLILVRG